MPQSTAALRQKAEVLRALRSSQVSVSTHASVKPMRRVWAKTPHVCAHGHCLALEAREAALWVLVRDKEGREDWAPVMRILSPDARRTWARAGFG